MKLLTVLVFAAAACVLIGGAYYLARLAPDPDPAAAEAERGIAEIEEYLRQKVARD